MSERTRSAAGDDTVNVLPFAPLTQPELEERYLDDVRQIVTIVQAAADRGELSDEQAERLLLLGASSTALLDAREALLTPSA